MPTQPFTWGTDNLDQKITAIEPDHLIVIFGSAGSGKTQFTFDVALKNALAGYKIFYASLEMTRQSMYERLGRLSTGITKSEWRRRNFGGIDERKLAKSRQRIRDLIEIKEFAFVGTDLLESKSCEDICAAYFASEADLLVVDNFNLVAPVLGESEVEKDMRVSAFFMEFVKLTRKPVILIHHTNKQGEMRGSKKIIDNATTVFKILRNTCPEAPDEQRAKTTLVSEKDRDFGDAFKCEIFFYKGSYYDEFQVDPEPFTPEDINKIFSNEQTKLI